MKKSSTRSDGFLDDFLEWMDSPEGTESMEALDYVFNALDGTTVDRPVWLNDWPVLDDDRRSM